MDDDLPRCIACDVPLKNGDLVYDDADGGCIHATCASDDPEAFILEDGGAPKTVPAPYPFFDEETTVH